MKRLLSISLALLMLIGSLSVVSSAAKLEANQNFDYDDTFTLGDLNGDGEIDMKDSNLIKSYILGREGVEEAVNSEAADLAADGVINSKDSFYLKAVMVDSITTDELGDNHQVAKLTIGGVDISNFTIYAPEPEGSNNNATYAAEIARKYIRVATGVDLEVKTGEPEGNAIVFNSIPRISEVDPDKRDELTEAELKKYNFGAELGVEGYQYKVENGSLYVYGTYRGNMYAIYEILEDYLGYRFYDNDHTFIYKSRTVDIPEGLDTDIVIPAMTFRFCGETVKGDNAQVYYLPSRMNGTQIYTNDSAQFGTLYGPQFINAHSYDYYWQMSLGTMPTDENMPLSDKYAAKLAEGREKWNADPKLDPLNWQPCASSESSYKNLYNGMIDTINMLCDGWRSACYDFTGRARKYVEEGQKTISFSLCDNESYCTCSKCRVKAASEGASGLYIDLANRAARDLQTYDNGKYAGLRVHCILYNHDIPKTVKPDKNVIVFYCGQGCNNHYLGTDDCGTCMGQRPDKKENNVKTNASLIAWGELCKETGAEMWYWYYGVQYGYQMVGMPNILNLYYDVQFLYNEANVRGIYYEGGGGTYNFGTLKAYLVMKMMWEPQMTFDQYCDYMKEYLYMYYGDGYEQLFQYILMQNEAAKTCGTCFISNFDKPADMYSPNYMRAHYEEMRTLLTTALELADKPEYKARLETIIYLFDFLGLSYVYNDVYAGEKATAETKALYEERCTAMWNYVKEKGIRPYDNAGVFSIPETITFDQAPIIQVYRIVSGSKVSYNASSRDIINNFFLTGERVPEIKDGTPEPTEIAFGSYTINY